LVDTLSDTTEQQISQKWTVWQGGFVQTPSPVSADEDPLSRNIGEVECVSDDEDEDESPSPDEDISSTGKVPKKSKDKKDKRKKMKSRPYELYSGSDVVGVVFLEISSITDLPPERNSMQRILISLVGRKLAITD
jgi:phosphatidylserine decarboxylase